MFFLFIVICNMFMVKLRNDNIFKINIGIEIV